MKISYFHTVYSHSPRQINLQDWLDLTIQPTSKLKGVVSEYRKTGDKKIKEGLPCVTMSATFKGRRTLKKIHKKNPIIVLDIDRKENLCIDMLAVRDLFMKHPSCMYAGLSAGGDGLYILMLLAKKDKLSEYFEHFREKLLKVGINIDESCKDSTRLRFYSYDKDAYLNKKAKPYRLALKVKAKPKRQAGGYKNNINKIESLIKAIQASGTDITQNYQDWIKVGAAIYNELGDSGINYFHSISSMHPDYSYKKCERKYNNCKKMSSISFGSLFHIASGYGIRY